MAHWRNWEKNIKCWNNKLWEEKVTSVLSNVWWLARSCEDKDEIENLKLWYFIRQNEFTSRTTKRWNFCKYREKKK